jgi:two-component system chemotaxis sensor kinase CheA
MSDMDDVVKEFLVESQEGLDQMERDLVVLEENPQSTEQLGRIFRVVHTIKGTCGFLAFAKLGKVAHAGENILSLLRDGKLACTAEIVSALLKMGDAIRRILKHIEDSATEGEADYATLIAQLEELQAAPAEKAPEKWGKSSRKRA